MKEPSHRIPAELVAAYRTRLAGCLKNRIFILCISLTGLFFAATVAGFFLSPDLPMSHRIKMISGISIGCAVVLFFNRQAECGQCIIRSKLNALSFVLVALIITHISSQAFPSSYSYSHFLLLMFFSLVLIPWSMIESVIICALHFVAFYIYAQTRHAEAFPYAPTLFGADPLVNGFAHLSIASVMCLIIRYQDNLRDVMNFLMLKEIETQKNQMEQELQFASRVQESLVPQPFESDIADVFVTYRPVGTIGGDYANFQVVDGKNLIFFIGDVTGHGVPAALMVNRLHSEFDGLARSGKHPGQILRDLNQFIVRAFSGTSMYLTAFCGMVSLTERKIYYSNYGHPPQYVYRLSDSEVTGLDALTSLLGLDLGNKDEVYENCLEYREGDLVFLFTDGILELKNEEGEEYGGKRLQEFIKKYSDLPASEMHSRLIKELLSFGAESFKDDVFIISLKCKDKKFVTT